MGSLARHSTSSTVERYRDLRTDCVTDVTDTSLTWITRAIADASRSGRFCTTGDLPGADPALLVDGVGSIRLPLRPKQAKQLIDVGNAAPFGKGTRTLLDPKVRRGIEIDGRRVRCSPAWDAMLEGLVAKIAEDLGLEGTRLEARLYKLLLYRSGGHFAVHRDSEKLDRMVASLVVMLPSAFSGGALEVTHHEARETVRFAAASREESPCFAAFYSDCEHTVQRVERGYRLCLTYNLVLKKGATRRTEQRPRSEVESLADALRAFCAKRPQTPLTFVLEHQYSQKSLAPALLKGTDRQLAELVTAAGELAGCRAHYAHVERHVLNLAEDDSGYSRRRRSRYDWDDDEPNIAELEIGEVIQDELSGTDWRDTHGRRQTFGKLSLDPSSVVSHAPFCEWVPSSEEYEGYTGNAGNTLDRWYQRSALVLWSQNDHFDLLTRAGIPAAIDRFESMRKKLARTAKARRDLAEHECWQLAAAILRGWPNVRNWEVDRALRSSAEPQLARFVDTVGREANLDTVRLTLSTLAVRDEAISLDKFMASIWRRFDPSEFRDQLLALFTAEPRSLHTSPLRRNLQWLSRLGDDRQRRGHEVLRELVTAAAKEFVRELPTERPPHVDHRLSSECLERLLQALAANGCHEPLARLVEACRQRPRIYRPHAEQADCLLAVIPWCTRSSIDVPPALLAWLRELDRELGKANAKPPAQPKEWVRTAALPCGCRDCAPVNAFLRDSKRSTMEFAAAKDRRDHVQQTAQGADADLDYAIDARGNPHRLVLSKSNDSYDRALAQYLESVTARQRLEALLRSQPTRAPNRRTVR